MYFVICYLSLILPVPKIKPEAFEKYSRAEGAFAVHVGFLHMAV